MRTCLAGRWQERTKKGTPPRHVFTLNRYRPSRNFDLFFNLVLCSAVVQKKSRRQNKKRRDLSYGWRRKQLVENELVPQVNRFLVVVLWVSVKVTERVLGRAESNRTRSPHLSLHSLSPPSSILTFCILFTFWLVRRERGERREGVREREIKVRVDRLYKDKETTDRSTLTYLSLTLNPF